MADHETNARIVQSRHVLVKYEQMPVEFIRADQTAQIVADEVTQLRGILREHPEKALTLGDLIQRWINFAECLGWRVY